MIRWTAPLIAALLLANATHTGAQTSRVRSAHYIIFAPSGVDLGRLADNLETAYRRLRSLALPLPSPITVRCHPNPTSFQRATGHGRQFLAAAVRQELHLQPLSAVGSRAEFPSVLLHELTHVAFGRAAQRGLPRWLNEGLAMNIAQEPAGERGRFSSLAQIDRALGSANATQSRPAYATARFLAASLVATYSMPRLIALCTDVGRSGGFGERFATLAGVSPEAWARPLLQRR